MSYCAKLVACLQRPLYVVTRNKGHSKWQNIKDIKGKQDKLRSITISRLLDRVRRTVKIGGYDVKSNKELAALQLDFRANNIPAEIFNNYLAKLKSTPEHTIYFEVIGPAGSFFIVETLTDNKNRKVNTMTKYFNKTGGFRFCTGPASIRQAFDEKGVIHVSPFKDGQPISLEKMEELGIELDCEDVSFVVNESNENIYELICDYVNLRKIENELRSAGYSVVTADLQLRAKHTVPISIEDTAKVEKFYQFLQEDPEVKQVFDNLEPEVGT